MLKLCTNIGLIIALLVAASNAVAGGDAERGQSLYQSRCAACHSIEYNGVGPAHKNVYGRKAGSAPDYAYSEALKRSPVVWNEMTLGKWLASPEKLIPGQKMGFSVPNAKDRADLIAYLKKASGS
jgi:cytochrome c